ncbi:MULTISPECIES: response regulator [Desulfosediminicola]|uniref:response regulator n=1 Tax=Desulfosediminicola TaxID=2886823 RepID=UPI0010ACAA8B|nr:response regulator [Desulfosediminicola ganghwensis]
MKILIVEDDFLTRSLLSALLSEYGVCHVAANGEEALAAVTRAYAENSPYDLICLDIVMPVMDGQKALHDIRQIEEKHGISGLDACKVIMITAQDDSENIMRAFHQGKCEAYLTKPLDRDKLLYHLKELGLVAG